MEQAIRFGILGPLEVWRGSQLITVNATKQRVILATLLLSANRVVLADELVERLWQDQFPRDARASLQTHLARLRRALGDDHEGRSMIRTNPGGYLIEVATENLDLLRYRSLLTKASRAENAGDLAKEARLLQEALALWRGTALADIASDSLLRDEAPQLTEEWFRALHRRFDVELMLGNHAGIVADLRRLTFRYPMRERLCGQLMIALFRCGRQVEALKAYASVASALRNEYGLDVGDELTRMHQAVLAGDPALEAEYGRHDDPEKAYGGHRSWATSRQLPVGVGDFVGRAGVLEWIDESLRREQPGAMTIVAVTGPPGVGKSATAVKLAHRVRGRFPDGQLFARMSRNGEPRDPAEVLAELLEATGMSHPAIPEGRERLAAAFRSRLADRRVLLVLDDAVDAEQVQPLLPGTPGCAVVITSRYMLPTLAGAVSARLDGLTEPESVTMMERMIGDTRVGQEPKAARRIAAACGHLPLALRIAGAKLNMQPLASLSAFADRLEDRRRCLDELRAGGLDVRHSLRQSYIALDAPARTAFRRLGLLPDAEVSPWTMAALIGSDEQLTDQLIEAGLLEPSGLNAMDDPTYRLHPLSAHYAAELATQDPLPSVVAALRRYVDTLLSLAVRASRQLPRAVGQLPYEHRHEPEHGLLLTERDVTRVEARPWKWLATERDRLFSAIARCCRRGWHEQAARLYEIVVLLARHSDERAALIRLSDAVRDACWANGDQRTGWRAEHGRAMLLFRQGKVSEARELLTRCVNAFEELEAWRELPYSLAMLAHTYAAQQAADKALELAEDARELARSSSDPHAEILTLGVTADIMLATEREAEAKSTLDRVLVRSRELQETRFEAVTLNAIGRYHLRDGDLRSAALLAEKARTLAGVGDRYGRARPLALLSAVALAQERHGEAIRLAEDSRSIFARLGDARGEAELACMVGEIHLAAGRACDAVDLLVPSLNRLNELGAYRERENGARVLAKAHATLGDSQTWRRLSGWADAVSVLPSRIGGCNGVP
ncbi:BTAD domain-containing putative transcriptional regulator [Streptosporangium sp. NPDC002524]|uniref:AfsR/SARP family transcriptional regulator n=1 Tax=Streptosporangium sp. NPDC002524 TaxID=3154537 RepID=UPI00333250E2